MTVNNLIIISRPYLAVLSRSCRRKLLFSIIIGGKGKYIVSSTLFDIILANIEYSGVEVIDLLSPEGKTPSLVTIFKGNMDTNIFIRKRKHSSICDHSYQ